jgi:arylsulfatase
MADHETGRVFQAIEDLGELEDTLVFYIAGDNGTSAEGGMTGLYNEMTYFKRGAEWVGRRLHAPALRRLG